MTHRQLSAARWLVANQVDVHHVNSRGWTPLFCLFGTNLRHQAPCDEYLEFLASVSFDNLDTQDQNGWTAMHRAAAFGTSHHIQSLITKGASPIIKTTNLGMTPIFVAVQFGNIKTFQELSKYQSDFLEATDIRGWTLLHLAVKCEQYDIMRILLEFGADPHALSSAVELHVPDDLKGLCFTPIQLANNCGTSALFKCLDIWNVNGYDITLSYDTSEIDLDVFWPASDHCSSVSSS